MKKYILSSLILIFIAVSAYSQGCSDAGFCTIGSLKSGETQTGKNRISIGSSVGVGDANVFIVTPYVQYDRTLGKFGVQAKLTTNYASGDLGSVYGLGDVFITGTYQYSLSKKWTSTVLLATKIFTNQANVVNNEGLGLPMVYQSSIGTIDVIAGITFQNEHWKFSFGLQQPLTGYNLNSFVPDNYKGRIDESGTFYPNPLYNNAKEYPATNHLDRKGDVLLNANYALNVGKRFRFQAGALIIVHLGLDTYVDPNDPSRNGSITPIPIEGSDGYTFNGTLSGWYKISPKITIGILSGAPFVARKVRPDGLTREWVIQPELIINF